MSFDNYLPLDVAYRQIRVVDLEPAIDIETTIHCRLRVVSLNETPHYEALSYTWGSPEQRKTIVLNGSDLEVRENLVAALRRLRHTRTTRTLWIDAICINQNDIEEKGTQVLRMGDIYERAQQVLAWLGEPDDERNFAMHLLSNSLWQRVTASKILGWYGLSKQPVDSSRTVSNTTFEFVDVERGEIWRLLDRPYFSRCWIQQEVVLARHLVVVCGSKETPWSSISDFITGKGWRTFWELPWTRPVTIRNGTPCIALHGSPGDEFILYNALRTGRQSESLPSVYQLLFDNRRLHCSDPRDRVFAIRSLIYADDQAIINTDYQKSVSQVYLETARSLILAHRSLYILNCQRAQASQVVDPGQLHSPLDQARFFDVKGQITDETGSSRRGWERLPPGWERQVEIVYAGDWDSLTSATIEFVDHTTGRVSKMSPLEGHSVESPHGDEWRRLPSGWHKSWDDLGRLHFTYDSDQVHTEGLRPLVESLDLPTWVPNWDQYSKCDPALLLDFQSAAPRYWASGQGQKVDLFPDTFAHTGPAMKLHGVQFDTVKELGDTWHIDSDVIPISRSGIHALEQWDDIALRWPYACPYADTGGRANAYWRTVIADYSGDEAFVQGDIQWFDVWCNRTNPHVRFPWAPDRNTVETSSRSEPYTEIAANLNLLEYIARTYVYSDVDETRGLLRGMASVIWKAYQYGYGTYNNEDVKKVYSDFRARIIRACAHRRILVSTKGYIGLAPWNAKVGDTIAVLQGGCTPFLIRPVPQQYRGIEAPSRCSMQQQSYELVGEAYVYGIMSGEVFESELGLEMETIELV